jgi:two-component system chemotaxis response regulator CheY
MAKTIVHADDSPTMRRFVAENLHELCGVKVVSVADGDAALEVLKESPCDLLLTDLEMPGLDGLDLAAAVRGLPHFRFIPIVIFSSRRPDDVPPERRQGVNFTGWITKPIEPESLRRWVRRLLPG